MQWGGVVDYEDLVEDSQCASEGDDARRRHQQELLIGKMAAQAEKRWKRNHQGSAAEHLGEDHAAARLDVVVSTQDSTEKSHDRFDRQNQATADVVVEGLAAVEIHADTRSSTRPISPKLKDMLSRGSDCQCSGVRPSL